jgi:TolB-like protein
LIYLFENYSLDANRRELRAGTELVPVEPQVFDVLEYLIRNRERVVSKDDLIAGVWKGRIVSESTLSSSITGVRQSVGDSGEAQRLIRTVARKGFRFVGDIREARKSEALAEPGVPPGGVEALQSSLQFNQALSLPDKPSIAILPFANISGDPEQEYFVDGIVEDITTALSQFRQLFVIARSSSFTYKSRAVDVKQVGRELGVRYVLEGSVRKMANRIRITAQLIDALTGAHLWADHFDGALEDIFNLQDQVTASVVSAIAPKLEQVEIERAKRKPTENLDAYDHYLRGVASAIPYTREGDDKALSEFYRAIELDPDFAVAYGWAAWIFVNRKTNGWMTDRTREIAETARLGRRAVELGNDDAAALCWGGFALAYVAYELDDGITYLDQALVLNPNLAAAWYVSGWLRVYLGKPEEAIEHISRAMRLSPLDSLIFRMHAGIAYAHFFAGRYDEASVWAEKAVRARPTWLTAVRGAAASHALAGRLEEARKFMTRMRDLDPTLRISNLKDLLPLRRPEDFAKWSEALQKAGLPE